MSTTVEFRDWIIDSFPGASCRRGRFRGKGSVLISSEGLEIIGKRVLASKIRYPVCIVPGIIGAIYLIAFIFFHDHTMTLINSVQWPYDGLNNPSFWLSVFAIAIIAIPAIIFDDVFLKKEHLRIIWSDINKFHYSFKNKKHKDGKVILIELVSNDLVNPIVFTAGDLGEKTYQALRKNMPSSEVFDKNKSKIQNTSQKSSIFLNKEKRNQFTHVDNKPEKHDQSKGTNDDSVNAPERLASDENRTYLKKKRGFFEAFVNSDTDIANARRLMHSLVHKQLSKGHVVQLQTPDSILAIKQGESVMIYSRTWDVINGQHINEWTLKYDEITKITFSTYPSELASGMCKFTLGGALTGGVAGLAIGAVIDSIREPKSENIRVYFEFHTEDSYPYACQHIAYTRNSVPMTDGNLKEIFRDLKPIVMKLNKLFPGKVEFEVKS